MTERPCIRCHHPLTLDGGQLVYCGACGAPQIFLSEELQESAALEAQHYQERGAPAAAQPEETAANPAQASRFAALRRVAGGGKGRWPLAVEYALLSSGIALGLVFGGMLFPPLLFLAWLWVVSAPMLTVSFYNARARNDQISAGFAARLGLLTGLLVTASCALVFTGWLVLARFVLHSGAVDAQIREAIAQIRANAAQYGSSAEPTIRLLGIPEFRVGFLLWVCTVIAGMYLAVSTVTAGVAGVLLRRRRPV